MKKISRKVMIDGGSSHFSLGHFIEDMMDSKVIWKGKVHCRLRLTYHLLCFNGQIIYILRNLTFQTRKCVLSFLFNEDVYKGMDLVVCQSHWWMDTQLDMLKNLQNLLICFTRINKHKKFYKNLFNWITNRENPPFEIQMDRNLINF